MMSIVIEEKHRTLNVERPTLELQRRSVTAQIQKIGAHKASLQKPAIPQSREAHADRGARLSWRVRIESREWSDPTGQLHDLRLLVEAAV